MEHSGAGEPKESGHGFSGETAGEMGWVGLVERLRILQVKSARQVGVDRLSNSGNGIADKK